MPYGGNTLAGRRSPVAHSKADDQSHDRKEKPQAGTKTHGDGTMVSGPIAKQVCLDFVIFLRPHQCSPMTEFPGHQPAYSPRLPDIDHSESTRSEWSLADAILPA